MKRKHARIISYSNPLGAIWNTTRGLFEAHLGGELLGSHPGGPHQLEDRGLRESLTLPSLHGGLNVVGIWFLICDLSWARKRLDILGNVRPSPTVGEIMTYPLLRTGAHGGRHAFRLTYISPQYSALWTEDVDGCLAFVLGCLLGILGTFAASFGRVRAP